MDPMILVAIILGGVIVLGLAVLLFTRLSATLGEAVFHFRCPGCHQRIRYTAHRVGQRARCPHCNKAFVFPQGDPHAGQGPRH
jgi:transposase-like protein